MRVAFLTLAVLGPCAAPRSSEAPPIPILHEDVFTPDQPEQVDLLWVVDSSPSMSEERAALADGFLAVYAALVDARIDFHIAVTTTACDDPGLLVQGTVLTNETPAATEAFRGLVEAAGVSPAGRCGIGAVAAALAEPNLSGANAGFYRDDADLKVIVVSDEDDASPDDVGSFVDWMNTIKPDPEMTTFSGLIGPLPGCADAVDGARYRSVIHAVGGTETSICQPGDLGDLGDLLPDLPDAPRGPSRFDLTYVPSDGVVAVWVNQDVYTYVGVESEITACLAESCFLFTYDEDQNSVEMPEFVPLPTGRVHVLYWIWP